MNRFFLYLLGTTSLLTFSLLFITFVFQSRLHHSDFSYYDVRGIELKSQGIWYTLNFEQQNAVIAALNSGRDFKEINLETCAPGLIEEFKIYRFGDK